VLDIDIDPVFVLEALVHESAHHHLCLAEMESLLVDPKHDGTYPSPLRPEPRPLRGILLAYHALAYICALYVEARACGFIPRDAYRSEADDLQSKLDAAESTLCSSRQFLTESGDQFFSETMNVAAHGRRM
jgi:HEXXH motif-containing protein